MPLATPKIAHYRSIIDRARDVVSTIACNDACAPQTATNHCKLPILTLPHPQPITPLLLSTGLSSSFADRLSQAYLDGACRLQAQHERQMNAAVQACLSKNAGGESRVDLYSIRAAYLYFYTKKLSDCASSAVEMARRRISELKSASHGNKAGSLRGSDDNSLFNEVTLTVPTIAPI